MFLGHRLRRAAGRGSVPQDYIAYWDMAGDALDETGNYNITLFNGPVQNADHVDFDGGDDRGECTRLAFNNNEFTIVTRFRMDTIDLSDGDWIINSRSAANGSENEWQIYIFDVSGSMRIHFGVNSPSDDRLSVIGPTIGAGSWYTFAFRFTGSSIEIHDASGLLESLPTTITMSTGALVTTFAKRGFSPVWANVDISRTIAYNYAISTKDIPAVIDLIENGA